MEWDLEITREYDRLFGVYQQRGLQVLLETAADELVKLRRQHGFPGDSCDLPALRAACERITPGAWHVSIKADNTGRKIIHSEVGQVLAVVTTDPDAAFIALARVAVPHLLDVLDHAP